ncbi:MAG: MATE family efflux transporter [Clostridia bacterium]|nr:MATE family efflux transporter [Clostridia bacterium]
MGKFIADKRFYKMVLAISIPIMIQNGITNFVNLLDNIMVGQIGTAQMSGVAIVNQIIFVFTLCVFGGCAGAGIFTAQYYGTDDMEGVRNTTRFKILTCIALLAIGLSVMGIWGDELISAFLHSDDTANLELALESGKQYLRIMMIGLVPMAMVQVYSSTLRETGETVVPMKAGACAVVINLVLNYLLIFDHFGHKGLGVSGAAIATIISRFAEMAIIIHWTHKHSDKNPYAKGLYRTLKIPLPLTKSIIVKGMPLLVNEMLWSLGMSMLLQCYSVRGLSVVAAANIASVISNVFNIVFIAMGDSIAIIVGQLLGRGRMDEAKDTDTKLIFFSTSLCAVIGLILVIAAPIFPSLYNTEPEVKHIATAFIRVVGICMPLHAFLHAAYFTLRSGGKTIITFLFDRFYLWVVTVAFEFYLTRYTSINIIYVYFLVQFSDIIKATVGFILLKKGIWLNNIVNNI